jgi:hypothetical protein
MAGRRAGNSAGDAEKIEVKIRKPKYINPKVKKSPVVLGQDGKFTCKFCKRSFSQEKTLIVHLCEQRRRFDQKDTVHGRYGRQAYMAIRSFHGNDNFTEEEFRHSEFYLACMRWGRFIIDVHCFNPTSYLKWLIDSKVSIDRWNLDAIYNCWLQDMVFIEDEWDALDRSIKTMIVWAEENKQPYENYFRLAGGARILFDISRALVSGWVVYCCQSGQGWLSTITSNDLEIIWPVINIERWNFRFNNLKDSKNQITAICSEAGL